MTGEQKQNITRLRQTGHSYADIANAVGLPEGTVKSFCWRSRLSILEAAESTEPQKNRCLECGVFLEPQPDAPPRKFCCGKCREHWWGKNRKPNNRAVCACCGMEFSYYGKAERRYCCQACCSNHRFGQREGGV